MLKVGTKVVIDKNLKIGASYYDSEITMENGEAMDNDVTEDMLDYAGKETTITELFHMHDVPNPNAKLLPNIVVGYKLDIDDGEWVWVDGMFEVVTQK